MDANVVSLDVLGEDAAVAAIDPAVEAGDRFQTLRRRLERGDVIVDEPAIELSQAGRHEHERQDDADEQPHEPSSRMLIDVPGRVEPPGRGRLGKDADGAISHGFNPRFAATRWKRNVRRR